MKSKEDLFQLIQSMSRSEKRYFTLDAQKSGRKTSKYLELFQAINEMEEYDEDKLRKKFGRHLPYEKSYLYEAILRSMRDYRSSKSKSARIKELILDSKYLYERVMYEQCEERLEQARQLAEELDDQLALLEINRELRRLNWMLKGEVEKDIGRLVLEKEASLRNVQAEFFLLDIYHELNLEVSKYFEYKDAEKRRQLQEKYAGKLQAIEEETLSPSSRRRYLQCKGLYYQLLGEEEKLFEYYTRVVEWWNLYPTYKEEEFYRYIVDVSNLLHAFVSRKLYHRILETLQPLEREEPSSIHDRSLLFQKVAIYKLMYYINTGQTPELDDFLEKVDRGLQEFNINIRSKNALLFNTAILLFLVEQFDKCAGWCDKIIGEEKSKLRLDIKAGAYLLRMIAIYESDDIDRTDKMLRSTQRYLLQKANLSKQSFEVKALHFLHRLHNATSTEAARLYERLASFAQQTLNDPNLRVALGMDELTYLWAKSKVERKRILRVKREEEAVGSGEQ